MLDLDTSIMMGIILSIGAGVISFFSPCIFPLFPAYISYLTGIAPADLIEQDNKHSKLIIFGHAISFLFGISTLFLVLGFSASVFGNLLSPLFIGPTALLFQRLVGIFIIIMGLFSGGWLTLSILMKERKVQYRKSKISYLGSFFVGLGFASGWTPCIGPILGSILIIAVQFPKMGILYMLFYSIGFSVPFLLFLFAIEKTNKWKQHLGLISKIGAGAMVLMGIILFLGWMPYISESILNLFEKIGLSNIG